MTTHTDLIARLREGDFTASEILEAALALADLAQQVAALKVERDKQLAERLALCTQLSALTKERDGANTLGIYYCTQLAASQAREAKLREALKWLKFRKVGQQPDSFDTIEAALALPADDSALQSALKAERERICGLYLPDDTASDFMDKIRGLA